VLEVLRDRTNGLSFDFFDGAALADRIDEVFAHPDRMQALRDAARATVLRDFDLESRILPRWVDLLSELALGQLPNAEPPSEGLATRMQLR
jgi:glycosyltransferase involved in cell wall biosynthesis